MVELAMTGVSNASITSILSASNLGQAKLPEDISGAITGTTEGIIESQASGRSRRSSATACSHR